MSIARRRLPMRASSSLRSASLKWPNRPSRQRRPLRPQKGARQRKRNADHSADGSALTGLRRDAGPGGVSMYKQFWSGMSGLLVGLAIMTTTPASADALKDEIAPT